LINYYDEFSHLSPVTIREGNELEQRAINNAAFSIYISRWAADSAIRDYGADKERIITIYPGPNIDSSYLPTYNDIKDKFIKDRCNLLLVGVDWQRKGCDIAIETVERLNRIGTKSKLIICGCAPPPNRRISRYVEIVPFLDKNKEKDVEKLVSLYKEAHYFILPTRAETLGRVLIEACAFGLPSLTTNIGGIPEFIEDGVNGFLFSLTDKAEKYADAIIRASKDKTTYKMLSLNAYKVYQEKMNWEVWTARMKDVLSKVSSVMSQKYIDKVF
jgi:glycosyltransferase involved in cell wall biosynthesis